MGSAQADVKRVTTRGDKKVPLSGQLLHKSARDVLTDLGSPQKPAEAFSRPWPGLAASSWQISEGVHGQPAAASGAQSSARDSDSRNPFTSEGCKLATSTATADSEGRAANMSLAWNHAGRHQMQAAIEVARQAARGFVVGMDELASISIPPGVICGSTRLRNKLTCWSASAAKHSLTGAVMQSCTQQRCGDHAMQLTSLPSSALGLLDRYPQAQTRAIQALLKWTDLK